MLRLILIFFAYGLLLQACTPHTAKGEPTKAVKPVKQVKPVKNFTQLEITGLIDVKLQGGHQRSAVVLRGDPRDLARVSLPQKNQLLGVNLGEGYPDYGRVTVEIHAKQLKKFTYKGQGRVMISDLNAHALDLDIQNKGRTTIKGNVGLSRVKITGGGHTQIDAIKGHGVNIELAGHSKLQLTGQADISRVDVKEGAFLSFYWVNSQNLSVLARDKSFVQLAGVAERMHVELCDSAHFNGRHLRAKRAFVKTFGKARAEISAVNRQHSLASDASDIYFYNIPAMRTDFMAFNGSVLDMRDWRMPFMQEYDRYNKSG